MKDEFKNINSKHKLNDISDVDSFEFNKGRHIIFRDGFGNELTLQDLVKINKSLKKVDLYLKTIVFLLFSLILKLGIK